MPNYDVDWSSVDAGRQDLATFGRRMISDGLAIGTAGNLSVRIGDVVAITPSSIPYDQVKPDDVCVVHLDGVQLAGGRISSEWPMHSGIYRTTDARAVVHTHSEEAVAVSLVHDELPAVHYAIVALGGPVPVVAYTRFGSDGLAESVMKVLSDHSAAILQNHGVVTYGATLTQAYDRAQLVEWLARVYRKSRQHGAPRILNAAELDEVVAEVSRRRYGDAARSGP